MPEMGIALRAKQLDTAPAEAVINTLGDFGRIQFAMKAWPATAGMILAVGIKQQMPAADTLIRAVINVITVFPAERCLGTGLAGDAILFRVQLLLPLLRVFAYFLHAASVLHQG